MSYAVPLQPKVHDGLRPLSPILHNRIPPDKQRSLGDAYTTLMLSNLRLGFKRSIMSVDYRITLVRKCTNTVDSIATAELKRGV